MDTVATPVWTKAGSEPPAPDVLIFQVTASGLSLAGGSGRRAGWAGIVDLPFDGEPLAAHVHSTGRPHRVGTGTAMRVIGPYWARHAALVPVGAEHLVVFGGDQQVDCPDAILVPYATQLVADLAEVSPAKLLADELEVVHAIRDLMEYRPERVAETARHIARKAAEPLSCEVGAVLVRHEGGLVAEVVTREWPARLDAGSIRASLIDLFERTEKGAVVELELEEGADDALGRSQGLVARFALPIGHPVPIGVLVVAHAATQPRGFTNLCQRIGHALAEVADSLLAQAISREDLAAERDRFEREARIDRLTGLYNRAAWDELVAAEEARRQRYPRPTSIVSADLDNLKAVNDTLGHFAGDNLIRAAADVLREYARGSDCIARVGGDEFFVLMPETDAAGARRFLARVRARMARVQRSDTPHVVLSMGAATATDSEPLILTAGRADAAMYAAKKRRGRRLVGPA